MSSVLVVWAVNVPVPTGFAKDMFSKLASVTLQPVPGVDCVYAPNLFPFAAPAHAEYEPQPMFAAKTKAASTRPTLANATLLLPLLIFLHTPSFAQLSWISDLKHAGFPRYPTDSIEQSENRDGTLCLPARQHVPATERSASKWRLSLGSCSENRTHRANPLYYSLYLNLLFRPFSRGLF